MINIFQQSLALSFETTLTPFRAMNLNFEPIPAIELLSTNDYYSL